MIGALNRVACISVLTASILLPVTARAADDTARFFGTWMTTIPINGQVVTIVSVHDASGYKNYTRLPTGDVPAGEGTFSAANGKWSSNAPPPNNGGVYQFITNDLVIATNAAGQAVTWKRQKQSAADVTGPVDANTAAKRTTGYVPPTGRPGSTTVPAPAPAPVTPTPTSAPAMSADTSMSPAMNAGMQAMQRKDYNTAWRDFMAEAQKGSADGEAAVGSMLYQKTNPPGTGYYAQAEKWLLASANQGNEHGMDMLAQFYFAAGKNIAGGINPGANNSVSPAEQQQADAKFALARQWFERSAAKGDTYAMGNLAILLDAGLGGPRDGNRAAQLRARVQSAPDTEFGRRATADPGNLAMTASWQAGHYADAIKNAEASAAKGDASAEALLGRAYFEGVGVPRNFATALTWLNKAVAQDNANGMFFLGLMYERGEGIPQDFTIALGLFDRAAERGQRYAEMEAKGMRMQGEVNRQAAQARKNGVMETACATAGGVSVGPECIKTGVGNIDPFDTTSH